MRLRSVMMLAALVLSFSGKAVQAQRPTASLALPPGEAVAAARLRMTSQPLLWSGQTSPDLNLTATRPSRRTGENLMIVGGAVLLAGLLADEAIISIAGVAIAGYGLYVYLEASPRRR